MIRPHIFLFFRRCLPIKNNNQKEHYVNEDIRSLGFGPSKIFRVIGPEGEQMGLMSYANALNAAYDRGLDLVLIAPQADPPVCKIIDYGRFRFERDKRDKEAKKKQQVADVKEIQLSCQIDVGDFNTKVNHARRFLGDGNKVKVIVKFRGRQMSHQDVGRGLLDKFRDACADIGMVDKPPVLEGRFLTMFLGPQKQDKASKDKKADAAKKEEPASDEGSAG